jgi:hypothetical protein
MAEEPLSPRIKPSPASILKPYHLQPAVAAGGAREVLLGGSLPSRRPWWRRMGKGA